MWRPTKTVEVEMTDDEIAAEANNIIAWLECERVAWCWSDAPGYERFAGRIAGERFFSAIGRPCPVLMRGSRAYRRLRQGDRQSVWGLVERWMRRYKFTLFDLDDKRGIAALWDVINRASRKYPRQRVEAWDWLSWHNRIINGKPVRLGFREQGEQHKWEVAMKLYRTAVAMKGSG